MISCLKFNIRVIIRLFLQVRCDRLLNALIPDIIIDLFGTELKDPTPRLQELLDGRQHLIDVKTVVPGEGYRRAAASVAAHANWRKAEVAKGYARKAGECDAAVPGDDTPFTDKLKSFVTEGRVLGPTVGCWCETSSDFDPAGRAHRPRAGGQGDERSAHGAPPGGGPAAPEARC